MITNEQIGRYFRQECSQEEAEIIGRYLAENPEKAQALLEEAQYGAEEEMVSAPSAQLWKNISRQTHPRRVVAGVFKKLAVAASILMAIGVCTYWWQERKNTSAFSKLAQTTTAYTVLANNGVSMIRFNLPDGSFVQLMPKSTVRFIKGFETNARNVELTGEARFNVVKNEHKPFTVYSENIATTALGTEFVISAFAADTKIHVRLITGKVVVKQASPQPAKNTPMEILQPGDNLVYHKSTQYFTVKHAVKTVDVAHAKQPATSLGEATIDGDNWYMFNNQSLPEVLDQLGKLYHREIQYNKAEIANMSFIGRLDKSDSLHKVLRSVALLNNLKLSKTATGYSLKK